MQAGRAIITFALAEISSMIYTQKRHYVAAFTIVELLIVVVVIAIIAAISVIAYNGIQDRARDAKVRSDIGSIVKAVTLARENESKTMSQLTLNGYTASNCVAKPAGTDLAALPRTDACWTAYAASLDKLSISSGTDIRNLTDPWGRPYFIDANEGEVASNCNRDAIGVYTVPFTGNARVAKWNTSIPLSGFSGCSL